jgi:hypothetical protein
MPFYLLKIYKQWGGRAAARQWSNSYLIQHAGPLDSPQLLAMAMNFVSYEKAFHTTTINFMRLVISTPEKEVGQARKTSFRSVELGGAGLSSDTVTAPETALARDVCLAVKKSVVLGRAGIELYRGALIEADVRGTPTGGFALEPGRDGAFINAKGTLMGAIGADTLYLDDVSDGSAAGARLVTDLVISGIVVKKSTNKRKKKLAANGQSDAEELARALPEIALAAGVAAATASTPQKAAMIAAAQAIIAAMSDDELPVIPGEGE